MNLKIFTIFVCVVFSYTLNAQIAMGTKYIGGNVGFNSSKDKAEGAESETEWSFSPEFGYFFKDNMAAGIALGLNGAKAGDNKTSGFNGLVYVRRFWNASDKFHVFGGLNVGYGANTITIGSTDSKQNVFGAFLDLGVWYQVSNSWSVAGRFGNLGFASTSNPDDDQDGSSQFGLNVDTSTGPFSLGLYYGF
jgi:hypothetical protein